MLFGDGEVACLEVDFGAGRVVRAGALLERLAGLRHAHRGAKLGQVGGGIEIKQLGSGVAGADFGVGGEPIDDLARPWLEHPICKAAIEIDPAEGEPVAEMPEFDADTAAKPVGDLLRQGLRL